MNTPRSITTRPGLHSLDLRRTLLIDAAVSGSNGLAYLVGAGLLDSLLGPSSAVLLSLGAFLVAYATALAAVGTREHVNRRLTALFAGANLMWVVGSVAIVVFGWLDLTATGAVWTVMQAAVVAAFAALQLHALRRN